MKWKDLSLKERKQIYDSVRANNPDATYLDIKQQFDSIPAYQDGKGKTINKADLPPEYRTGTPEYFERQRKISGAVNTVQPEAYITPAGYIKAEPFTPTITKLKDSGKITNWSTPVDESMVLEYIKSPTPNKLIKDQYNLYRNKNEYIERLNKLIPMEILMPLGGAGFVGNELNKE